MHKIRSHDISRRQRLAVILYTCARQSKLHYKLCRHTYTHTLTCSSRKTVNVSLCTIGETSRGMSRRDVYICAYQSPDDGDANCISKSACMYVYVYIMLLSVAIIAALAWHKCSRWRALYGSLRFTSWLQQQTFLFFIFFGVSSFACLMLFKFQFAILLYDNVVYAIVSGRVVYILGGMERAIGKFCADSVKLWVKLA